MFLFLFLVLKVLIIDMNADDNKEDIQPSYNNEDYIFYKNNIIF